MPRPLALKTINLLTLIAVIALNGLAATGAMSGDSIGVIANRYQSLFLPANWVFGIWSLIYAGLIAAAIYQWLPLEGVSRALTRLGWWWLVAGVLNVAWISVAVISNSFQFAHVVGFGGFGISELAWSITMMSVATLLGAAMAYARGMWVFPLVVAWAIYGIGARYADLPAMADATQALLFAGLGLGLIAFILGLRRTAVA